MSTNYVPKYIPGPEPCVIKSYTVTRGRLLAIGTFFRVRTTGNHTPQIESAWLTNTLDGSLQPIGTIETTTNQADVQSVRLRIWGVNKFGVSFDNTYYAAQNYNSTIIPPATVPVGWISGIPSLRTQVNNADPLLSMPTEDVQQPYDSATNDSTYLDIGNGITTIGKTLPRSQGEILQIRTGPNKTLINLAQTETDNIDDGTLQNINQLYEWTGLDWIESK